MFDCLLEYRDLSQYNIMLLKAGKAQNLIDITLLLVLQNLKFVSLLPLSYLPLLIYFI